MDRIIGLIGTTVGIIGLICSIIFYFKQKPKKQLAYKINTICLISKKTSQISGLKIKHDSHRINNLYSSTIQIQNIGNTIINKTDIQQKHPFSIHTSGRFILDAQNMQLPDKNNVNDIKISFVKDNDGSITTAIFNFEYIEKGQLITFTLLHTDKIEINKKHKLTIKGGQIIESNDILDSIKAEEVSIKSRRSHVIYIAIICFISTVISFMYMNYVNAQNFKHSQQQIQQQLEENIFDLEKENHALKNKIDKLQEKLEQELHQTKNTDI